MIAVDTNIIVRLLTRDDESQYQSAHTLFNGHDIYISKTVMLEVEWVLRYAYEFETEEVSATLLRLGGLENVQVEDARHVATALQWHAQGLDFADALHLAASQHAERFITFDRRLISGAQRLSSIVVELP